MLPAHKSHSFPLGATVCRGGVNFSLLASPPILWDIESDPALAGTKFIAEAWDATGLYQVGSFVGDSWHVPPVDRAGQLPAERLEPSRKGARWDLMLRA